MKTYLFKGKHYGGGKSSGFPGLGWMVYDIIKDWADKNRPASFGELTAAFPQTLRGGSARAKDALFAPKQDAETRPSPRHVHKNRRFFVITTGDDSEYAVSKEWGDMPGDVGDIGLFVAHACGMGFDIEKIGDEPRNIGERANNGLQAAKEKAGQQLHGHKKPANKRHGEKHINTTQNYFVRYILGHLGDESFSAADWQETQEYFGGKCAYCGNETEKPDMDHAVPINKDSLGEHRLGNLVPSCGSCNNAKGNRDYRDFLADNVAARKRIEEYMRSRNYSPIKDREDAEKIGEVLKIAYHEIKPLADKYIRILNSLLD